MMNELRFALYAIKKNIQSSAELRTSFLMNIFGMTINNCAFILLWVFFVRSVGVIGGWTATDIVGLQGFVALSFGLVFSAGAGIRKLPDFVATGAFDRFMLSPKQVLVRVATASFGVSAIGDIVFGAVCLALYAAFSHMSLLQLALIPILVITATTVFLAAMIIVFSMSFFFVDSRLAANGLFEFFLTPSLFHGGAFRGAMRFVFTFMVPSLLIGTVPVEIVRDMQFKTLALIILLAIAWCILSIKIFNRAVKKYESANFLTFGG